MRVMVTGSSGFLGTEVRAKLGQGGHQIVEFDRTHGLHVERFGDVMLKMKNVDAVIHLAGVLGTAELFNDPHQAVDVNVRGTLNVILEAHEKKARYVGITMPEVWDNVYQATKRCGKGLASAWHRHHDLHVSHVRAFNAYGIGQKVHGVQKIVPTFATLAWRNDPIPIWGDGTQTVDMVWSRDVARMLVDALDYGDDEVFDAGTGVAMTVLEVAEMVIDITGSRGGVKHLPMRAGEHETKIVAQGEGWDKLGWHPEFDMERFVQTVEYYREERP